MSCAEPFHDAVDENDCPDYHEVVTTPIDLSEIERRIDSGSYLSREKPTDTAMDAFMRDIRLLRENCELYCAERYPAVVAQARILYDRVAVLAQKYSPDACIEGRQQKKQPQQQQQEGEMEKKNSTETFTVCARLVGRARDANFLVPLRRYRSTLGAQRRFVRESHVVVQEYEHCGSGVLVDVAPLRPDGLVPWRWLSIDWANDLQGVRLPARVNPWEIAVYAGPQDPSPSLVVPLRPVSTSRGRGRPKKKKK